jgi:hypothetical protein
LLKLIIHINSQNNFDYYAIGGVKDDSIRIKAKSSSIEEIQVKINGITKESKIKRDTDGYFDISINELTPNTNYIIDLINQSIPMNLNLTFKTFPSSNSTTLINDKISFVATSYSRSYSYKNSWEKIKSLKPNFFMMLGNMYDDKITSESWKDYEKVFLNSKKNISKFLIYLI